MMHSLVQALRRVFRAATLRVPGSAAPKYRHRPVIEQLEDRSLPSCIWNLPVYSPYLQKSEVFQYSSAQAMWNDVYYMRSGQAPYTWQPIGTYWVDCSQDGGSSGSPPSSQNGGSFDSPGLPSGGQNGTIVNYSLAGVRSMMGNLEHDVRRLGGMDSGWRNLALPWRHAVQNANSVESLARLLLILERHIPWSAVDSSWKQIRPLWMQEVSQAHTAYQIGELTATLRGAVNGLQ
jgi:hypothetical protein